MKRTTLYIGLGILGGIGIFIAINKWRKKNLLEKLNQILDTGGETSGEKFESKVEEGKAVDWQKVFFYSALKEEVQKEEREKGKTAAWKLTSEKMREIVSTIRSEIKSINIDEDKINLLLASTGSLYEVGWLNNTYQARYNIGLFKDFSNETHDLLGKKKERLYQSFKNKPLVYSWK